MGKEGSRKEDTWREAAEDESVLLNVMLESVPTEYRDVLAKQAEAIRVRFDCECGCPSVSFEVPEAAPLAGNYSHVAGAGYAYFDDSENPFSLELFIREGKLRGYDVTPMVDPPSPQAKLIRIERRGTNGTTEVIWTRSASSDAN